MLLLNSAVLKASLVYQSNFIKEIQLGRHRICNGKCPEFFICKAYCCL